MNTTHNDKVKVRFAPSPTGYLHVGGARTAIFNWLFAQKYHGEFFLRIEDTDVERSGQDMVQAIIAGLQWLGLQWDGDEIYQSNHLERYSQLTAVLVNNGNAYKCFCSKDELEHRRQQARRDKRDFKYRHLRTCLQLNPEQIQAHEAAGHPHVIRFKLPDGETVFSDAVYGEIRVNHQELDDFVIVRPDGYPVYHLAVVIDDHDMAITHVIRGDDHLSNTPKHILLYHAYGWSPPVFAHVPLILGQDKQRLSKRHGATAVSEYQKAGYLAEVMFNFLAILGWSSGDDREIFTRSALIQNFSLAGIQKKGAVFDDKKLEWMNGLYLNEMSEDAFSKLVCPYLVSNGFISETECGDQRVRKIVQMLQPRTKKLSEIPQMAGYFFSDPVNYENKGVSKHWKDPEATIRQLALLQARLCAIEPFDISGIEKVLRDLAEELELSAGKLIHPLRLALTGLSVSPGIFEVLEVLGKETVARRIDKAIGHLRKHVD